jgi:hypothetical protein
MAQMAGVDSVAAEQPAPIGSEAPSASVQQSAANQNVAGWFYLDAEGQHMGPFTTDLLAGAATECSDTCPMHTRMCHGSCHMCNLPRFIPDRRVSRQRICAARHVRLGARTCRVAGAAQCARAGSSFQHLSCCDASCCRWPQRSSAADRQRSGQGRRRCGAAGSCCKGGRQWGSCCCGASSGGRTRRKA